MFGVFLPLLCFAADPFVFRSSIGLPPDGRLWKYKIFAYLLGSASIMAMTAWLLWGERLRELRPFVGGLFITASAVSFLVGLLLLPISMIASIFLIGLLGFTPLISSFVYLRNTVRIIESVSEAFSKRYIIGATLLAALYAFVVPYVVNFYR
jgi:hypothetical protein